MSSPPSTSPPSSRPPAGVPDSGNNAKYAIVAILLLLGAGGLYAWHAASNRADQPAPIPSTTVAQTASAAPTNPKLDDIPLPPPPEEKPEAGPPPKIVYVPAGGCDAKCSGQISPELEQALQIRGAQSRRCYNQALAQDSSLKGHVTVTVKVGSSGNLCSANVTANDMGSAAVANCAANIFRSNTAYPAPKGGCVELGVPLSFVPQGQ
jgi:outer membrane biosynthesis protein TonB